MKKIILILLVILPIFLLALTVKDSVVIEEIYIYSEARLLSDFSIAYNSSWIMFKDKNGREYYAQWALLLDEDCPYFKNLKKHFTGKTVSVLCKTSIFSSSRDVISITIIEPIPEKLTNGD